ncbi:hypothetical protein IJH01_00465 [Candidatus Saccharibacteria bacterium]|nr:hypothetical protein [Candidatus Saccharibacteria bacterium]
MEGIYYYEKAKNRTTASIGVEKKILQQIKCLKSLGQLKVINYVFSDNAIEKIKFLLPFIKSNREMGWGKILEPANKNTRYIYIRKPSLTTYFYKVLKKVKRLYPSIFIIIEIPTYPFHSEYTGLSRLMIVKSVRCEKNLSKVVDRIATYSDDKAIWGIPTIRMSNCVNYNEIKPRSEKFKLILNTIRLTCVSNFMYWHGLDRLINGIKEYEGDYHIILNVVGGGQEIDNLKKLSVDMDNIIFHGAKTGDGLDKIFDETDIAVDALGRHRSGVYYNSSLKGKEYVARGVPVISAVKTELDDIKFPYYLKLPADESYINIDKIIDFYEKIYKAEKPQAITNKIRILTEELFDYQNGFTKTIEHELTSMKNERTS